MAGREILAKLQADIVGQKILELKSPEILDMGITAGRGRKVEMHMDHAVEVQKGPSDSVSCRLGRKELPRCLGMGRMDMDPQPEASHEAGGG